MFASPESIFEKIAVFIIVKEVIEDPFCLFSRRKTKCNASLAQSKKFDENNIFEAAQDVVKAYSGPTSPSADVGSHLAPGAKIRAVRSETTSLDKISITKYTHYIMRHYDRV